MIDSRLTEVRLSTLGSITYGALEAKEKRVWIFPVRLANGEIGSAGVVLWGDTKATTESVADLIKYLDGAKDCLPSLRVEEHPETQQGDGESQ